ncbi:hypothetical protein E2C01_096842 [Portunus trituberculatus]|uniref:RRM domain-containing protein n=1 Tax=Portunus trituberculatus TaxID=210409 RepID=A0A5B7JTK4_PORTR|nr:hypothetical protein [Portunus trituberculatus]
MNKTAIEALQTRVEDSEQRMNYQEDYNRRNNIRTSGLNESPNGETWEQTANLVSTLLGDKLQLPPMKIERAHRVRSSGSSAPRTIVVRFEHFQDREAAMRNARKLKGTGIYFNENLCPASQEKVKNQLPLMKQAQSERKIAYFKYTRFTIKEQTARPPVSGAPSGDRADSTSAVAGGDGVSDGGELSHEAGRVAAAVEAFSGVRAGTVVAGDGGVVPSGMARAGSGGGESGDDTSANREVTTGGGEETGVSQQKLNRSLRVRKKK